MSGVRFRHWVGFAFREAGVKMHEFGGNLQGKLFYQAPLSRHRRVMAFNNFKPTIGQNAWIAPNASVIGKVEIGSMSSIWYGSVIRGDVGNIKIGKKTNIQDRVIVHVTSGPLDPDYEKQSIPTVIGDNVTVEAGAILHACTLEDGCKVEFGAKVLDGATVGTNSIISAGSLVPPGRKIPSGQVWAGTPAVFVRNLSDSEIASLLDNAEQMYQLSQRHDAEHVKSYSELYKQNVLEMNYTIDNRTPRGFTPPPIE